MAASNTPPQCVFEIVAVEAIRKYLSVDLPPEDVAHFFASTMADQYDIDNLSEDILAIRWKYPILICCCCPSNILPAITRKLASNGIKSRCFAAF